jgi:DNA mismatch repair protein MutL
MLIKQLSQQLINKISAGEVVERPASAVKELLDNAIDSGASKIEVQILSADARSFRVTDNGCGILPEEVDLAFTIHATSKINSLEDLSKIETKGFRGEALASIAAVSEIICLTKHKTQKQAIKATFDPEGKLITQPAAFTGGTSLEIYDLFGKVPARLKFLKKPETELQLIQDINRELAIAHPEISFNLQIKDKQIFKTSGSGQAEQTLAEVLPDKASTYRFLQVEQAEYLLYGWIAPLTEARSDARGIITLLNKRPIQCQIMRKAIKAVYKPYLPSGKQPRLILNLTMPPELFDVNVHPTKREVRYQKPQTIFQLVQNTLEKHLILTSSNYTQKSQSQPCKEPNHQINFASEIPARNSSPNSEPAKPAINLQAPANPNFNSLVLPHEHKFETDLSKPVMEAGSSNLSASSLSFSSSSYLAKISDLEIRQINEPKGQPKEFVAHRANASDFCLKQKNIYASGNVQGSKWIRESLIEHLSNWLFNLDLEMSAQAEQSAQLNFLGQKTRKNHRPKLKGQVLKQIWQRDNWRCVYCGKHLIEPSQAQKALRHDPESWIERLGSRQQPLKTHLFREHQATYDHYLPYSHNPSLGANPENLYACCRACNQAKSNSTDQAAWQVSKYPAVTEPVNIGNLYFQDGQLLMDS